MQPTIYLAAILVVLVVLFLSWLLHRWLRRRRLARGDEERERIKDILTGRSRDGGDYLEQNPRETVGVVFELLGDSGREERDALLTYLEVINFREVLAEIEIRSRESDYGLLVVTAALGMNKGWRTSISWLDRHGSWQWTAAIHALSYWPGPNADQVLVTEMASLAERYEITDRAFNQPIIGAISRRGKKSQSLALDYLSSFTPPNLQIPFLMFFKEVEEIDREVEEALEDQLCQLWKDADDEIKASILSVAVKHGLEKLVPVARNAIGTEVDFVQLWAVRLLAKCSPANSYLDKVKKEGSPRARREVDELQ